MCQQVVQQTQFQPVVCVPYLPTDTSDMELLIVMPCMAPSQSSAGLNLIKSYISVAFPCGLFEITGHFALSIELFLHSAISERLGIDLREMLKYWIVYLRNILGLAS